jgi:hypothetical protein
MSASSPKEGSPPSKVGDQVPPKDIKALLSFFATRNLIELAFVLWSFGGIVSLKPVEIINLAFHFTPLTSCC